mmetsp:Transcript_33159/g.62419  ORF Transcript_33159/g.62419 Transcript_33159/m.62419 type:complete len:109 (+) Transcript_33159:395-721(+)
MRVASAVDNNKARGWGSVPIVVLSCFSIILGSKPACLRRRLCPPPIVAMSRWQAPIRTSWAKLAFDGGVRVTYRATRNQRFVCTINGYFLFESWEGAGCRCWNKHGSA